MTSAGIATLLVAGSVASVMLRATVESSIEIQPRVVYPVDWMEWYMTSLQVHQSTFVPVFVVWSASHLISVEIRGVHPHSWHLIG